MKSEKERMDIIATYREVGSYRAAADLCGTTHKTVRRIVEAHEASQRGVAPARVVRERNYDDITELVTSKVRKVDGRISAKRLLPLAKAAGYRGSDRNFRRLVAKIKTDLRLEAARYSGRRPGVWVPGETLIIDWGEEILDGRKVHLFNAVLAWSRVRFVRFADNQRQATTLGFLAECFETLGGVPMVVLADRMNCLKANVVANVVVPTADYVRFATHYGFRPDFCEAADPKSKGMVERLVGYAKTDLLAPLRLGSDPWADGIQGLNQAAGAWCVEVNSQRHSEIAAIPLARLDGVDGLDGERALLAPLPSLRLEMGPKPITRKVDKLSCIRYGSARYSVPHTLIGATVTVLVDPIAKTLSVVNPITGEVHATHAFVAPGEVAINDDHYGKARPEKPARAARARTKDETLFLALDPIAEVFLKGAAAAGVARLGSEIAAINLLVDAHGPTPVIAALKRAVEFCRWRADDVRSILATNGAAPTPQPAGNALVVTLPTVPRRSLADYALPKATAS